jgi:hypothetical protein
MEKLETIKADLDGLEEREEGQLAPRAVVLSVWHQAWAVERRCNGATRVGIG